MIVELLQPDANALCEQGVTEYINEFKAILNDKLADWDTEWTRTTTSPSSIVQAVNYFKMRAIPREPQFKQELIDFIAALPC